VPRLHVGPSHSLGGSSDVMHDFQDFFVPQMHPVLIGQELLQPGKMFHSRELTDAFRQGTRHTMPPAADVRVSGCSLFPTGPAAVTGPFHDDLSAQALNGNRAPSAAFHGTPTAHRASNLSGHPVKTPLNNHGFDPLAKSPGRLFDLDGVTRNHLIQTADFAPVNSDDNLNEHHALLGNTGLQAPGFYVSSKEGTFFTHLDHQSAATPLTGARRRIELRPPPGSH
jgi:hypothetical protein